MSDEEQNNNGEIKVEAPLWYIDEGMPGMGARPSWLHRKI